jgi:hypothetical protein
LIFHRGWGLILEKRGSGGKYMGVREKYVGVREKYE